MRRSHGHLIKRKVHNLLHPYTTLLHKQMNQQWMHST